MLQRLFRLFAMVWAGSLLTIGYLVAPVLFSVLPRADAGNVAAVLFHSEALLGLVCGVLMLTTGNALVRAGQARYRRLQWIVLAMVGTVLIGYFALQPWMGGLRDAARDAGVDLAHSRFAARFGLLHAVSSAFYLVESLLAVWLIWRLPQADAELP